MIGKRKGQAGKRLKKLEKYQERIGGKKDESGEKYRRKTKDRKKEYVLSMFKDRVVNVGAILVLIAVPSVSM